MLRCPRRVSASSARPERAAELWRSRLREEGGVGTDSSSSVRRTRSSRGAFRGGAAAFFARRAGAAVRFARALRVGRFAERDAADRFLGFAADFARRVRDRPRRPPFEDRKGGG